MVQIHDFKQLDRHLFEVPVTFRKDMRVPARIYADEELLKGIITDNSLQQLINTATLPGIVKYALAMPDIHQGYGFPIGGVVATELPHGIISPGGVGYDINCGVRLLATHLDLEEVRPYLDELATILHTNCPSGVGKGGNIKLKAGELDQIMSQGTKWAVKKGYGTEADLERTEENGCLAGADPAKVSQRAKDRGKGQVGTLGAGNHFIELDVVQAVFNETAAQRIGLWEGQIAVQIHCGSRGLGHQVCGDYVKRFQKSIQRYGLNLPDRELVCAPLSSAEGQDYHAAMKAAANYAFVNRQVLTFHIRNSFEQVLAGNVSNHHVFQIYDIAHNMAKVERHRIDGEEVQLCVHRKGATRAFGPGSPELPPVYRDIGQPVLVPGSMGTASWVLVGTERSMSQTFGSTCHGAGRTMSRKKAKKTIHGATLREELEGRGIHVRAGSMSGLAEEAPSAYKDVDRVVEVVHSAGIAKRVAQLKPVAVIKG
jgi:tRNA-splicing ligase RtcB